jgi:hypothetical protein
MGASLYRLWDFYDSEPDKEAPIRQQCQRQLPRRGNLPTFSLTVPQHRRNSRDPHPR